MYEELINMTEHCTRIAYYPSTHVLQIDECVGVFRLFDWHDWKKKFHELVLKNRSGRSRHYYVPTHGCINIIAEFFRQCRT